MIRAVTCTNFPPFGEFKMDFPPVPEKPSDMAEVHLLTGINGTGKTQILCLLAAALGQSESLKKRLKNSSADINASFHGEVSTPQSQQLIALGPVSQGFFQHKRIGPFTDWLQKVPAFAYSGSSYITDSTITVMADIPKPDRAACLAFNRLEGQSGQLVQGIANLKVQAAMDMMDAAGERSLSHAARLARTLEQVFKEITGHRLLFQVASYPKANLTVTWENTNMPIDGLPEGLKSIIGWLAHSIVMMDAVLQGKVSPLDSEAVFLLDEVEGFLHPAWQRKILPAFQKVFPKAQMFVATHSPFVIASLNHGWIHQLTMSNDGKVKVERPKAASEGDSYVTVVEDIMGVKELYDVETEGLLAEFRTTRDIAYTGNPEALEQTRNLAKKIGHRSMELDYMMGRELNQMDRQLARLAMSK